MISIASALEKNISLEKLDLSYCDIDDDGIQILTHALKYNTTLRYLNIEGNKITSSGMYALLKCIYDTSSMQSLWESNHTLRAFFGFIIYSRRWVRWLGRWWHILGNHYVHATLAPLFLFHAVFLLWLNRRSFPETAANRQLVRQIREIFLWCYSEECCSSAPTFSAPTSNLSHKISARNAACKILRHYVKEDPNEYWECVEGMGEKLVPNIVGWLTSNGNVGVIYRVLKDMPWLLEKKAERNACQGTGSHGVGWEPNKTNDVVFDIERSNKGQHLRNILLIGLLISALGYFRMWLSLFLQVVCANVTWLLLF